MRKKTRNFMRFLSGFLVLMLCLTLIPTIQANASDTSVDLVGDSSEATPGRVKYGVRRYGVGMLVISALDDDITGGSTVIPDDPDPSEYDGTVYTLTATGGSSSSGSGSSATTYFGNGSGRCLSGSL